MLQNNSPSPQRRDPNGLKVHFLSKWKIILLEFSLLNNMKDECYLIYKSIITCPSFRESFKEGLSYTCIYNYCFVP